MSEGEGPWGRRDGGPPRIPRGVPRPPRPGRPGLWLLWLVGFGGLVLALVKLFPEMRLSGGDWTQVGYLGGMLLLVAGGYRIAAARFHDVVKYGAAWILLAAALALGYAYRGELAGVPRRLALAFGAARPVVVGPHELAIPQDDQGAFEVVGQVNGRPVRFVVDTGSSQTVLAPADARRLGIDTAALRYRYRAETANGTGHAAGFVARRLQVGPIAFDNFPMAVNQTPMSRSLLGLSFLNRLESFQVRGRSLYLTWREGAGERR